MPKIKVSDMRKVRSIIKDFKEFTVTPKDELYCPLCCCIVMHEKRFFVEQHVATLKHRKGVEKAKSAGTSDTRQTFISSGEHQDFATKLVQAFASAEIPMAKVNHPAIRQLFRDLGQSVPSETLCRLKVKELDEAYDQKLAKDLSEKPLFFVIDETELRGKNFLHILCGTLDKPDCCFLVRCSVIDGSANSQKIIHELDDVIKKFKVRREDVNLLISDAASYMCRAGNVLKEIYPNLLHVTCLAHLMHNCALKIKSFYKEVDDLIATVKASVVKNKTRAADFDVCGRPPQPVVTRWGSWLDAANYYAEKLPQVREIVNSWNGEGMIVQKAKSKVNEQKLASQLTEISQCYNGLSNLILKMENSTYTIQKAYEDINSLGFGSDPLQLKKYIKKRLEKNDVKIIVELSRPDIPPALYAKLLQFQPTLASVERSFSLLKSFLRPNRNFADVNIEHYMKLYFNA